MSSQEFISDMKKLFAVCAICNFELKYANLASWTILVTFVFEDTQISLCAVSPDVSQCLSALRLSILATLSMSPIPLYHGEHVCTWTSLVSACQGVHAGIDGKCQQ